MKSKFPEVSEIAEIRCKLTAATHPPTHSLIRHNAVLFLVTIKGPLSAGRSCLFSVTSLHFAFEGWSVFSVFVVMQVGSLLQQLDPSHLTAPHRSLPRAEHCWSKEQLTNQLQVRLESRDTEAKEKGGLLGPGLRARQSPAEFQKPCSCLGRFFQLHGIREKPKDGKCLHPSEKNCLFPMSLICAFAD